MNDKPKKIFISDDDTDILSILRLMLQTRGYAIYTSTFAYDLVDNKDIVPDLILLDIWMSGIDGRVIARQLKDDPVTRDIPIIFISANSRIKEIAEECGVEDFIAKPFEMEELLRKVKKVFDRTDKAIEMS